jgi:hypothetical protein
MTVPAPVPSGSLFDETNAPQSELPDFGVLAPVAATPAPRRRSRTRDEGAEIKAIETPYAGYRFRSRTEAKWAVAFDRLGIEWIYEPETYRVGPFGSRRGYLPDFYLPRQALWVEVKGHAAAVDGELMLAAADPVHGLPLSLDGTVVGYGLIKPRLLVLGPIQATPTPHDALIVYGGEVVAYSVMVAGHTAHGAVFTPVGFPQPAKPHHVAGFVDYTRGWPGYTPREDIRDAYRAARMARFEHEEFGAPAVLPEPVVPVVKSRRTRKISKATQPAADPVPVDDLPVTAHAKPPEVARARNTPPPRITIPSLTQTAHSCCRTPWLR